MLMTSIILADATSSLVRSSSSYAARIAGRTWKFHWG
jgi:hypothetical protein